jgi:hypothetical protein
MKKIITVLLLFPLFTHAQDCRLKKGTDDLTSRPTLSTGFIPFDDFSLSMDANGKEIDFFFQVKVGSKCFDENSVLMVTFEGKNQKQQYKNSGGMNCDGIIHVIFKNLTYTNTQLTKLATKKSVSIAFTDLNGKTTTVAISPEQQKLLTDNASCISVQAKTLIGQ